MKNIRLFWWNETIIMNKPKENYGDLLGKYLVEKISGKKVVFAWPKKFSIYDWFSPIYVTIGSILANVNHKCIVWGSGIIDRKISIKNATFLAVRGPQTRQFLLQLGYQVPEVYGDPALLLPNYYHPKIEKQYEIGIIPHVNDYQEIYQKWNHLPQVKVIHLMTNDIEATTNEILACKRTISSSLHGIIVSHAYQIPSVWVEFSDKLFGDGVKFQDYFESVDLPNYQPVTTVDIAANEAVEALFQKYPNGPQPEKLEQIKKQLLAVCPFVSTS